MGDDRASWLPISHVSSVMSRNIGRETWHNSDPWAAYYPASHDGGCSRSCHGSTRFQCWWCIVGTGTGGQQMACCSWVMASPASALTICVVCLVPVVPVLPSQGRRIQERSGLATRPWRHSRRLGVIHAATRP